MKTIGIYPNGINNTVVQSGWGRNLKVKRQFCYGDGFPHYNIDGSWFVWDKKAHHYPFKDIEMNNGKIVAHCKAAKVEKKIIGSINYYRTKIKDLIVYDSPKDDVGEIFKKDVAPQFVEEGEKQ